MSFELLANRDIGLILLEELTAEYIKKVGSAVFCDFCERQAGNLFGVYSKADYMKDDMEMLGIVCPKCIFSLMAHQKRVRGGYVKLEDKNITFPTMHEFGGKKETVTIRKEGMEAKGSGDLKIDSSNQTSRGTEPAKSITSHNRVL